ncbi:MAG: acyltransferase [Rhizobiales bacterium]|nr:acyltransferase [Hyphomicrobiales bacterium]
MRSSGGEYYVGLDHVRALAAFLVFNWHFMYINKGNVTPLEGTFDIFLFSLFAEGHTGVSVFMVLSGYLFAKITNKQNLDYPKFLRARALRLLPLLLAVAALVVLRDTVQGGAASGLNALRDIGQGVVLPTLPNGGWSITVEFHFYLLFPLLVLLERRFRGAAAIVLLMALVGRLLLFVFSETGATLQYVSYGTIFGRIDQFIIGMLVAYYGQFLARKHLIAVAAAASVFALYHVFDRWGGLISNTGHPEVWIYLLTVEGLCYGVLIGWYDRSFAFRDVGLSGLIAKVGAASYSIYLLHIFVVFGMARFVDRHLVSLDTFTLAFLASIVCFVPVAFAGWLSYRYFESYWLQFRVPYVVPVSHN